MADSSPHLTSGAPRWLKVFGIVFVLLVVLFVGWHLIGDGLDGLHHPREAHSWPDHTPPTDSLSAAHAPSGNHTSDASDAPVDGNAPARGDLPKSESPSESIPTDSAKPAGNATAIAGCWELVGTEHPLHGRLHFIVEGNSLRGAVTLHGEEHQIREGKASGHRFNFKIEMSGMPSLFEGELKRSELRGTLTRSSQRLSWTAQRCPTSK